MDGGSDTEEIAVRRTSGWSGTTETSICLTEFLTNQRAGLIEVFCAGVVLTGRGREAEARQYRSYSILRIAEPPTITLLLLRSSFGSHDLLIGERFDKLAKIADFFPCDFRKF